VSDRSFVDTAGPDYPAALRAVAWTVQWALDHGSTSAGLFVNSMQQIEPLGQVIGESSAKRLGRTKSLTTSGVKIDLLTERTAPMSFTRGPVVGVWVNDRELQALDDLMAPAICAVPWSSIEQWKATWGPLDIDSGTAAPLLEIANPVVEAAMKSLTLMVNLSTGLGHPSDKASAIGFFKQLKAAREPFDVNEVRAWARRNGWRSRDAEALSALVGRIDAGAPVRGGQPGRLKPNLVQVWREEVGR
jgi:hypothetical protein